MKRFDEYDQKYHIYLREIKTGLGEIVYLLVYDEIFPKENYQNFFFLK